MILGDSSLSPWFYVAEITTTPPYGIFRAFQISTGKRSS
jgi:hypothetical protein